MFWTWILLTDLQGKSEEILELIVSRQLGAFVFSSSVISCRFIIAGFVLSRALDVHWLCDAGKPPKLQRLTCKGTVAWCSLQVLENTFNYIFDAIIFKSKTCIYIYRCIYRTYIYIYICIYTYTVPVQIYTVEDCGINEAKLANHLLLFFSTGDCCRISAIDLSGKATILGLYIRQHHVIFNTRVLTWQRYIRSRI